MPESHNQLFLLIEKYVAQPFVERLIGTIRREYLDQVPFWGALDLERKLLLFRDYYNHERAHRGRGGVPPAEKRSIADRKIARLDDYRWEKRCRDLYQLPAADKSPWCRLSAAVLPGAGCKARLATF